MINSSWQRPGITAVYLVLALSAASRAVAQQPAPAAGPAADTTRRDTVVLLPAIRAVAESAPSPVAASAVTMSAEAARSIPARDVWDLVRQGTGIEIHLQGQGPGFASSAVIRGFTSDHSSDVALVVDGVPLNEPINGHVEGYADWNQILPEVISRVTVLKGPMSPLYGSFAMGGAMEVRTVPAVQGWRLVTAAGSNGFARASGTVGSIGSSFSGIAAADVAREDGWRPHSGSVTAHAFGRGTWTVGEGRTVGAMVGGYGADWDSPGYLSLADFEAGRLRVPGDPTDGGSNRRLHAHLTYEVEGPQHSWRSLLYAYGGRWHMFLNIPPEGGAGEGSGSQTEELDRRVAVGLRSIATWTRGSMEYTAGGGLRGDVADFDRYFTTARTRDSSDLVVAARHVAGSAFGQAAWVLGRRWRLTLGLRADAFDYRSRNRAVSGAPWISHGVLVASPKGGVAFLPLPALELFANVGRGFRPPDGVIRDPALAPVSEWASEAGVRVTTRRLEASLTAFRLDVRGEQTFNPVTLESTPQGRSRRQGLEGDARVALARGLAVFAHWTRNDARYTRFVTEEGEDLSGSPVFQVARDVGEAGVDVEREGVRASVWASHTGSFTPIGEPTVRTRPYTTVSARIAAPLTPTVEIALGLQNLMDQRYAEVRAGGFVGPGAPRRFVVTLRKRS